MSELYEKSLMKLELDQVLSLLADCAGSEGGKESCRKLRPSSDLEEVELMLQQTTAASDLCTRKGKPVFSNVCDVSFSLERADRGGSLQPKELLSIGGVLRCARNINGYVSEDDKASILDPLFNALTANKYLEDRIFGAILSEEEIADTASSELADIRRHMRIQAGKIRDSLQKVISSPAYSKFLREPIITIRQGRYVVPVKSECKNDVPGLVHDVSATGSTYFVEPMSAVNANNALRELELKEKKEIERILAELSSEAAAHAEDINLDYNMLVQLDVIFAKANLAYRMRAWAPIMNDRGKIELRNARHPLIDPQKVVPISLRLGSDFDTMIITGPNTGGKTVTLKTVGLLSLMTQAGLLIPADFGSEMAVFDEVFADIGDEQSIEQSLSTFSSHMTNIVKILSSVTEHSLALFDELGAGTDPTEGAALAMSILDHLLKQHVTTMATTHYSELKVFALTTPGVENASVEFNVETLRPTYRLSIGVPGKSNAFEISRKLGLPDFLIEDAGRRLTKDQVRFEDVIANAEYHRQVAEKERKLAEEAHIETTRLRDEAEKLQKDLASRREEELRKAKADARKVLLKAQREAESIISDLKKTRAAANVKEHELHEVRARLQSDIDDTSEKISTAETGKPLDKVNVGDTVELTNLGVKAEILTLPDAKGECTVQAGALKLKANLKNMRSAQPDKPKKNPVKKSAASVASGISARAVERECDVRGMNLEEAICAVDLFLDGAIMNKLNEVYIIHGKGTGILRAGIQKHLRSHPAVKEFRLGRYGEGEDGVTVVTLK